MADNTDHNDLAKKRGLRAVKKSVDSAIDAAKGLVFGFFTIMAAGVFWKKSEDSDPVFFSSFIKPLALARSPKGTDFALHMEMRTPDATLVQFLLRFEDLHLGGGEVARIEFARRGGYFGPGIRARQVFSDFINSILRHGRNLPRLLLADRCGWMKINNRLWVFVLPDTAIGQGAERIILQQALTGDAPGFEVSGTLAEWNQHLGRYSVGNSRLILAVCAALAGPLLAILNREGGGLHLVGKSSEGKTTALCLAASVMGDQANTVKTLDATANAIEGAAALANDALLPLDEVGQAAPDAIGSLVYKLASGIGRGRADQRGEARNRKSWRCLFLTTGETDLETMLRGIGKRPAAGQQLRLANIPAAPDNGFGIFEELHGFASGAALSDHIRQASGQCHGAPFRAFLEKLVDELNSDPDGLRQRLLSTIKNFVATVAPDGSDGQVIRVAARFALLAAAGEYAARHGLLSWPEGEAEWGVRACFEAWVQRRGGHGPLEVKTLLEQFTGWLQANGEARFTPMDGDHKGAARPVINRAGFRREVATASDSTTATEFFIFPAAFREAVQGYDPRWSARILAHNGLLAADQKGELCRQKKLPGMGNARVYHVPAKVEEGGDDAEPF